MLMQLKICHWGKRSRSGSQQPPSAAMRLLASIACIGPASAKIFGFPELPSNSQALEHLAKGCDFEDDGLADTQKDQGLLIVKEFFDNLRISYCAAKCGKAIKETSGRAKSLLQKLIDHPEFASSLCEYHNNLYKSIQEDRHTSEVLLSHTTCSHIWLCCRANGNLQSITPGA